MSLRYETVPEHWHDTSTSYNQVRMGRKPGPGWGTFVGVLLLAALIFGGCMWLSGAVKDGVDRRDRQIEQLQRHVARLEAGQP